VRNNSKHVVAGFLVFVFARAGRAPIALADEYADSLDAFLHSNFDHKNFGVVVGIVNQSGNRIYCAGRLDNGTDKEVDGNTIF